MARGDSSGSADLPQHWQDLLRLLPGYDPFAAAGDCWFEPDLAQRAIDFIQECVHHVEGSLAGKPFLLESWQQAVVANLFGWQRRDEQGRQVRRYREVLIYVPRKNGKTPFVAAIALLVFFLDGEAGQQNYLAADNRIQAGKLFRQMKGMVEAEPELAHRCRVYGGTAQAGQAKSLVLLSDPCSFTQVISAEASGEHGGTTHLAAVDELHTQPNRDLVDVLQTSFASSNRRQPLFLMLTTADFQRPSICNEKHSYAVKVRDGIIEDPSFLPVIYEATPEDPWDSEDTWRKANPNLGVSVSLDYLRRECARAREVPAYENTFRRLHLNQRTEQDVRALPMERWDACADGPLPRISGQASLRAWEDHLRGRECYAALDLASTTDLAALVLWFPDQEHGGFVLPYFWAPAEGARLRERRDRVPYETWGRQGLLTLTEGPVIDYDRIRLDIGELGTWCRIKEIACDRWNATQIINQLMGDGFEVVAFGQGFRDMTAPTKELLKLVVAGRVRHGGHPVLRWMASNLATESDAAGNLKPSKKRSPEKIDGMVALIMALGRWLAQPAEAVPEITWI